MLTQSSNILKKVGASLCTQWLAEEPPDAETNAILDAFGSLELDLDWVYDLLPASVLEPEPVPNWYINLLSSEQEIEGRLDALLTGSQQPAVDQPQPTPDHEEPSHPTPVSAPNQNDLTPPSSPVISQVGNMRYLLRI